MFKYILILVTLLPVSLFAHEGHHDTPGTISPPKGGVVRSFDSVHFEMLQHDKIVKIFVYDKNLKPALTKDFTISATATRPRKKPETLKLITEKNNWQYQYDAKGAHRYTLKIEAQFGKHKNKLIWNIEPKHAH